jgi:hypothetical protein
VAFPLTNTTLTAEQHGWQVASCGREATKSPAGWAAVIWSLTALRGSPQTLFSSPQVRPTHRNNKQQHEDWSGYQAPFFVVVHRQRAEMLCL